MRHYHSIYFSGFLNLVLLLIIIFPANSFCQSDWEWRIPQLGTKFIKMVYGNGTFTAIGQRSISTSTDGVKWTSSIPKELVTMQDLAYGSNRFVIVCDSGRILSSPDGKDWTLVKMAEPTFFMSLAFGNNRFVAIGTGSGSESSKGICFTSSDGLTWTRQQQNLPSYVYHMAFGNQQFMAICWSGPTTSVYSSPDGEIWNYSALNFSGATEATFVHDRFLVFSQYDLVATISTSFDTKNWTGILSSYSSFPYSAAYANNLYIIQQRSGFALTSPNCTTWTEQETGIKTVPQSIAVGQSTIAATTQYGGIVTSSDGISWNQQISEGRNTDLYSVAYGNGRFVAVEKYGRITSSTDAVHWTWSDSIIATNLNKVSFVNNLFFAMGEPGKILTSPDGLKWTAIQLPTSKTVAGIVYHNGVYVLAGHGIVYTSNDATTWTLQDHGMTYGFTWIANVNNRFLFNIDNDWLLSSPDGITWTKEKYSGPLSGISSIAFGNGKYIGVGSKKIVSSIDGITWTVEDSLAPVAFYNLLFCNNQFVAITTDFTNSNNHIATSSDGINWTLHNIGLYEKINSVTFGDSQFVAVGANGAILASKADPASNVFHQRVRNLSTGAPTVIHTSQGLSINLPSSVSFDKYDIQLITGTGRKIQCILTKLNSGVLHVSTAGLCPGIYYVKISGRHGVSYSSCFNVM